MSSDESSSSSLEEDGSGSGSAFVVRFSESFFGAQPSETWLLRRPTNDSDDADDVSEQDENDDTKPGSKKRQKLEHLFQSEILTDSKLCLAIAGWLDPIDMMSFFQTCKAAHTAALVSPDGCRVQWQALVAYFKILQVYHDQLVRKLQYCAHPLVRYFMRLAHTMQAIYGPRNVVHPIHRAVVAQRILDELCGVTFCDPSDDDDDYDNDNANSNPPLFHPKAPRRSLEKPDYFYTNFRRFTWCPVMGDYHYSFALSDCLNYGHGNNVGITNESVWSKKWRTHMLQKKGQVFVFMYQDEDEFRLVSLARHVSSSGGNEQPDDFV